MILCLSCATRETAYPSGSLEVTAVICKVCVAQFSVCCAVLCRSLFSVCPFGVFRLAIELSILLQLAVRPCEFCMVANI